MYASNHRIRMATDDDEFALRRLASRNSRAPLAAPTLVGEIAGAPVAAVSLLDDRTVADPNVPTDHLLIALRARARA